MASTMAAMTALQTARQTELPIFQLVESGTTALSVRRTAHPMGHSMALQKDRLMASRTAPQTAHPTGQSRGLLIAWLLA
jgi:hypothetical protein